MGKWQLEVAKMALYMIFPVASFYAYHQVVSRLRKREDQALVSISTILKFPAQNNWHFLGFKEELILCWIENLLGYNISSLVYPKEK